jgi:outer membrane protein assembly factor BamB
MAVSGGIAYSASPSPFSGDPGSNADIRLRAFDIPTGALLWEDVWDASTRSLDDSVSDIAASAGRVFITAIGGSNSDQPPTPFWVVRAYAGSSGTVLWEDRCPSGHASRVTATSTWVYVLGACSDGTDEVARVRAYATATGKLRWEIRIPNMLATNAITLSNDRLVVACIDTSEALVLRAYDIKRGKFLWQRKPQTP